MLIALALILFLSAFFGATYVSIRASLLTRSDEEVRQQLQHVISELHQGITTSNLVLALSEYNRTGESQLHYSVLEIRADSIVTIYPRLVNNDSLTPPPIIMRKLTIDPSQQLEYFFHGVPQRVLAVRSGNFIAVASFNNIFLDEASEFMIEIFAYSLLIGLVLAAAIGYVVSGFTLTPITILVTAARTILHNPTRSPARLPVSTSIDEVAELARSINELLDQREASLEQMRNFTADAAHELRTPLTVLKGEIEVELRLLPEGSPNEDLFRSNLEEVERLISIVQDLLYLATMEAEPNGDTKHAWECSALDAVKLARNRLATLANSKAIQVRADFEDVIIRAEEERITRLIYNVLLNAIQHTRVGSEIVIDVSDSENGIVLSIRDHGEGIAPGDVSHIFDRFYRADKSRSREHGGAGLGLAIAKSIADRYGFVLNIESELGKGTTVNLFVPYHLVLR